MTIVYEGGCQCGSVRYRFHCAPVVVYVCHCTDCQKQSSSAFGISVWVPRNEFELTRGKLKLWITRGDSGNTKQCTFCPDCGSRIYHASQDQAEILSLKGGSLDQSRLLRPAGHIWTRSGQAWAVPEEDTTLRYSKEPESFEALISRYSGFDFQRS